MSKTIILLTFFIFLPISLFAVLPPQILKKQSMNANEVIKIKVIKVNYKKLDNLRYSITAEAKVIEVKKSKSNLKKGDIITISYTRKELKKGMAGPKPNPFLSKNETTGAFLYKSKDKNYSLSAKSASFNDNYYKNYVETKVKLKSKDKKVKRNK